jgi:UDP-N-acetylmuramate dehydrogenase
MARHTSFRIGGSADLYVVCDSIHDLTETFAVLNEYELPWAVCGKGSNLLVADTGFRGAIITLGKEFKNYTLGTFNKSGKSDVPGTPDAPGAPGTPDAPVKPNKLVKANKLGRLQSPLVVDSTNQSLSTTVVSGAGVILSNLVNVALSQGLSGFEFAVGIPGTLGGALFMNAGSGKDWIGSIVENITVVRPGVGLVRYYASELLWDYRQSGLPVGEVIVEGTLRVKMARAQDLRIRMEAANKRRKATQPLNMPSAGSVFRNPKDAPDGMGAGALIEKLGMKGYRIGDAMVSDVHANFIVNCGKATAADVVAIIVEARKRVKEEYGIELQPEIRFIGF